MPALRGRAETPRSTDPSTVASCVSTVLRQCVRGLRRCFAEHDKHRAPWLKMQRNCGPAVGDGVRSGLRSCRSPHTTIPELCRSRGSLRPPSHPARCGCPRSRCRYQPACDAQTESAYRSAAWCDQNPEPRVNAFNAASAFCPAYTLPLPTDCTPLPLPNSSSFSFLNSPASSARLGVVRRLFAGHDGALSPPACGCRAAPASDMCLLYGSRASTR